ncbi:MAG: FlgA N-terminal domain, partial [Pseudomonadota bacterium]
MGRTRKQLTGLVVSGVLALATPGGALWAQRALIPSAAETSSALASKELDLPSVLVDRITKLVKSHPSLIDLKVEVRVGKVRQAPAECQTQPEITFASKSRPWGNFNVLIRCSQPFWAVTAPVSTRVFGPQVTAA